jgi:hypothetical protein
MRSLHAISIAGEMPSSSSPKSHSSLTWARTSSGHCVSTLAVAAIATRSSPNHPSSLSLCSIVRTSGSEAASAAANTSNHNCTASLPVSCRSLLRHALLLLLPTSNTRHDNRVARMETHSHKKYMHIHTVVAT